MIRIVDNNEKSLLDQNKIQSLETQKVREIQQSKDALTFHLMPPVGWMNDPNGLCQLKGVYHIFFQYSPYDPNGADKYWGHYETQDFIYYIYTGVFLSPDSTLDKDGVYSGSAFIEDDTMYLYYTGNIKEDGVHDYIYEGRGSNTIMVTSTNGRIASDKECLLTSNDYPSNLSCHVRDPKVFQENDVYYLILGARTDDDKGCTILYKSDDLRNWIFTEFITSSEPFGYMWECPDLFLLSGKRFLSVSPQGVESEEYRYQNIYQSGYFLTTGPLDDIFLSNFTEWDMGFDFYAPQTFEDEKGRRILIGWMGIPDAPYTNPTIEDGWQHALTLPRELSLAANGRTILQKPLPEMEALRADCVYDSRTITIVEDETIHANESLPTHKFEFMSNAYELLLSCDQKQDLMVTIDQSLILTYLCETCTFTLSFLSDSECGKGDAKGYGRTHRKVKISSENGVHDLHIYCDRSSIEVFLNDGEYVLTSRYYRNESGLPHNIAYTGHFIVLAYSLNPFEYEYTNDNIKKNEISSD